MKAKEEGITHAPKGYNEKLATPPEGIGPLVKWGKKVTLKLWSFYWNGGKMQ